MICFDLKRLEIKYRCVTNKNILMPNSHLKKTWSTKQVHMFKRLAKRSNIFIQHCVGRTCLLFSCLLQLNLHLNSFPFSDVWSNIVCQVSSAGRGRGVLPHILYQLDRYVWPQRVEGVNGVN